MEKAYNGTDIIKESIHKSSEGINHISLTAQSQAEMAQKLHETIQKFKLKS